MFFPLRALRIDECKRFNRSNGNIFLDNDLQRRSNGAQFGSRFAFRVEPRLFANALFTNCSWRAVLRLKTKKKYIVRVCAFGDRQMIR